MPYVEGQERSSSVLIEVTIDDHGKIYPAYYWWCPGCASYDEGRSGAGTHLFHIPPWTFDNDDMEKPTFSASYLSHGWKAEEGNQLGFKGSPRCHSFVKEGMIQYLDDCEHELAGKIVPMASVPDWLRHNR